MWEVEYTIGIILACGIIGYELYAGTLRKSPTISQMVWRLTIHWPWLRWVGSIGGVLLILHFWWGLW